MASSLSSLPSLLLLFIISLSFTTLSVAAATEAKLPAPTALFFPLNKDSKTLQFYTTLELSSRGSYANLVVHLSGEFTWFNCDGYNLASYIPVACDSSSCEIAMGDGCRDCEGPAKPGCSNHTCNANAYNPLAGLIRGEGFGEDFFHATSTDGRRLLNNYMSPYRFIFSCSDYKDLYENLARPSKGLISLSRTNIAFQAQFANAFSLGRTFSLCFPATSKETGSIVIGGAPYYLSAKSKQDASKSFVTTPLIVNPVSDIPYLGLPGRPSYEYFIDVKSIKIAEEAISIPSSLLSFNRNGDGGTTISTLAPYTVLHSTIYKNFIGAFEKAAISMKIKKVEPVAPFGSCFSSNTIAKTISTGPDVPMINIVLRGRNAEWKIYGANSMVEVKKGVSCLAFVDAGGESPPRTSIVLGGHQLGNYLLEFDLDTSKLGFTSLLLHNTTCSKTRVR